MQKKVVGHVERHPHAFYWIDKAGHVYEKLRGGVKKVVAKIVREAHAFYYVSKGGSITEMKRK